AGFDYDTVTYQIGGQREVSPGWFVGGSVAYESSKVRANDGSVRGDGDSGYAGMVVKRQEGPWVFSAAVGGGYGGYRMDRFSGEQNCYWGQVTGARASQDGSKGRLALTTTR
ncbi:hypothetical protein CTI14_42380, partial [Methylobacterium radiotolerans]